MLINHALRCSRAVCEVCATVSRSTAIVAEYSVVGMGDSGAAFAKQCRAR